jgi:hypothetical protein
MPPLKVVAAGFAGDLLCEIFGDAAASPALGNNPLGASDANDCRLLFDHIVSRANQFVRRLDR